MWQINRKLKKIAEHAETLKTNSTGIFEIFEKIKLEESLDNKIEAIQDIAKDRLITRTGFALWFHRKRDERMQKIYENFSFLNTRCDNRQLLRKINNKLDEMNPKLKKRVGCF